MIKCTYVLHLYFWLGVLLDFEQQTLSQKGKIIQNSSNNTFSFYIFSINTKIFKNYINVPSTKLDVKWYKNFM